ncbi:MAG: hypothetical protein RLZZ157_59 [Pseudomonadota bacterium]|jgi:hypothetical protein
MQKKLPPNKMVVPSLMVLLVGALGLQGCATNLVTSGDMGTGMYTEGVPYRLPIIKFSVDVSWQLSSCKIIDGANQETTKIQVGFTQLAEISSELGEGEALIIDYRSLNGPFKTGKVDVDYWTIGEGEAARQTMFVKSINSEIEGHEVKAIQAATDAFGKAASLDLTADGVPKSLGGTIGPLSTNRGNVGCNSDIVNAVETIEANSTELKRIAKKINDLTLQVALISGRTVGGKLTTADDLKLGQVQTAMDELTKQKEDLEKLTKSLKELLTYKQSYSLAEFTEPTDWANPVLGLRRDLVPEAGKVSSLALKALDVNENWCVISNNSEICDKIKAKIKSQADSSKVVVTLDAVGIGTTGFTPAFSRMTPKQLKAASFKGFVFREPVPARLKVMGNDGKLVTELATTVPQYGRVRVLPLRSGFGEKNELSASFADNGVPTKVTYNAHQAGGVAIFASATAILDQANTIADRIAANNLAKDKRAKSAELDGIKDKIALLTEQQKLDKLTKGPNAELDAREAELAKLRFEVERMELLSKLGRTSD